ncbi:MAG: glycosyltransferase [Fimbriimonadaceae bacterium]
MRIALFSDSVLPVLNGVSVSIDSLVSELRNKGHSVHIFAPQFPGLEEPDPNTYRFRSVEMPFGKGFPLAYPPYIRMLRKFRRHEFDVIHTHTIGILGFLGLRWAESHDLPIVATYHTLYDRYAHYVPYLPRRYARFKIAKHTNFYYNSVDHVITPSEASLRWLRRHSVTRPATVIPTGCKPPGFFDRSETRLRLGITPDQRILLFVGRLAIEKNMETLFEAAAMVMASDSAVRLWIVGDGPYRVACHALARRISIGDRVKFVGFVPHNEVDAFYAAADLFVFASVTETQGLVVQEAMTYGLPPVLVDGGGAGAGVEHGISGLLVRNDPGAFASAINAVLSDDALLARLSTHAARSVRGGGPSATADRVVEVYASVLRAQGGSSAKAYASVQ